MIDLRPTKDRANTFSRDLTASLAHSHHSATTGKCPHCGERTRWAVRPLNNFYRCLQCGADPLEASRPTRLWTIFWKKVWGSSMRALSRVCSSHAAWSAKAWHAFYQPSSMDGDS